MLPAYTCSICGRLLDRNAPENHYNSDGKDLFLCEDCAKKCDADDTEEV